MFTVIVMTLVVVWAIKQVLKELDVKGMIERKQEHKAEENVKAD